MQQECDHGIDSPKRTIKQLWNGKSPNEDASSNTIKDKKDKGFKIQ